MSFRAVDIIRKKRDGEVLTQKELSFFVQNVTQNKIPDYQTAAFLMACFFRPLNFKETLHLTKEMMHSGKTFDFSDIDAPKIDKHSTGGVGDKTSLIVAPIVASYHVYVPMISGRGLGHTGGTVDKLESIPGFNMQFSFEKFGQILREHRLAMMGQTQSIAPADGKMYALRDVTATVECIPLIAASIMSKKLAEGINGLVLDVKFGHGAFMQKFNDASELAKWLVKIGQSFKTKTIAIISDMNQPLGNKIGNSLEVEEAIEVLKGKGPKDLVKISLTLSGYMLLLGKKCHSLKEGIKLSQAAIENGQALQKFKEMVKAHGGDERIVESFTYLPLSQYQKKFLSWSKGYVTEINARSLGNAASLLGCGRQKVEEPIDPSVGFTLHKKVGDPVQKNEPLLTIHYNHEKNLDLVMVELRKAYRMSSRPIKTNPLIKKAVGKIS